MRPLDRVRGVVAGAQVDHLPAQPMLMMFAAGTPGSPTSSTPETAGKWRKASSKWSGISVSTAY